MTKRQRAARAKKIHATLMDLVEEVRELETDAEEVHDGLSDRALEGKRGEQLEEEIDIYDEAATSIEDAANRLAEGF